MARITLGIKGLRENLGRDDGIVPLFYLWTDYMRPLLPQVSLTKWTKANEKGRHSYQLDRGMDLLERGLCDSHTKVPYESMIEPEESIVDVVVQLYPWFKFSFLLFLGMIMYDNNMIMSLKQKKRKFEPRIKLNHNMDTITHYHHHHHHHHYHRQHHHHNHFYRAYSLTWPASMLIFTNKRKFVHKKRVQFPQGCLATQTWPPFHCFGTPIWPPWRHVNTLYSLLISLYIKRFHVDAKFYGKQGILWTE